MAGHARYTALLDACVLFPLAMVDSLMSLAEAGLYAAKWSTRIEEELIERNIQFGRDRVEAAHGWLSPAGLDLGDQAW